MNENDAIVGTEPVTTPAPEDENNVAETAAESATGTDDTAGEAAATTAEEEASTAAQVTTPAQEDVETDAQPFTIPVKFEGIEMNLTLEEAVSRIQRGMMYDKKLSRLASDAGQSVEEYINSQYEAQKNALYEIMLRRANGDEDVAHDLFEHALQKRNLAFEKAEEDKKAAEQAAQNSLNDRLASDFIEVQAEFPEYGKFSDLPKAVVKMAVDKNISLYDALLRHERAESKKIDTAKQQQAQAAAASVGSQAAQPPEKSPNPMIDALMAGLQRGLG